MSNQTLQAVDFGGLHVVAFESRRAKEIAKLISQYRGVPLVGPAMREVPLEENPSAFTFAENLFAGQIDTAIFMTGVGSRTLIEVLETRYPRERIVQALSKITVVARGPKPTSVLRECKVPITITVPEPNTWREILQELDENPRGFTLEGSHVAVQEYGVSNEEFLRELSARGAEVLRVPVYRWAFPEDIGPLQKALEEVLAGRARIVLFTNAVQVDHVAQVAAQSNPKERLKDALRTCVVCSVGPTCTEALLAHGFTVDLEPEHPRMGALVQEAAKLAPALLREKAPTPSSGRGSNATGSNSGQLRAVGTVGASLRVRTHQSAIAPTDRAGEQPAAEPKPAAIEEPWHDSRFMKACRLEPADATPLWLMRQAGRYMKEYRELRAKVPFLELCKNPDLVTELTVTSARRLGVDAAIIFADLLLIVEPLGFGLEYDKGEGPVISPVVRRPRDLNRMREVEPQESLRYLFEAIRQTRAELDPRTPLIGFGAAPFTLASYMIEGGASKNFRHTKSLMYCDPGAWRALMEHLVRSLTKYINGQIEAGVQAVQIFDTWVGCLGPADYREFVLPHTRSLIQGITTHVPVIHFGTGTAMLLEDMRDAGGDVFGLDFRVELRQAWARLGNTVGVQGNLDPLVLFAEPSYIRARVQEILDQAGGRPGHVFNLGHGILPDTPYENVVALVGMVHDLSSRGK